MAGEKNKKNHHFVLVHGGGHGAWCWYRLSTLLESLGHRVTAPDLAGCGVHPKRVDEVRSIDEYVGPLMEVLASLPGEERVILVGHSFGGIGLSLAMERFPEKVSAAVYASAIMPCLHEPMVHISLEFFKRNPFESMMDSTFTFDDGPDNPPTCMIFGPEYLAKNLYQCCSSEDLKLATTLVTPAALFPEIQLKEGLFSEEKFGSVKRVFVVCGRDYIFPEGMQRWMIQNNPPDDVVEIETADHMVMLSEPQNLCDCLLEIADKYD
ncbi:Salicylic acid-binding protein 2 [Acorus gramineus]|uniref:Salicylic acid-binding protein 2 n=1 Tax=Acorus gramineus TaxID=55184 RepID=A0AAV9BJE8_ACOGR|nr:Salicylic acid-binding protein 2 [Acorus gramineus]